ncbi:RDD family protein [Gordonia alkaliphila]|uniref:RDD domain-containing protein n=1 Tax=Gordonia alkaliphila TaxID=1053547 RepID=A0ABP8YUA2_9ACTN
MTEVRTAGIVSRTLAAFLDLLTVLAMLAGTYLTVAFVAFLVDVRSFDFPTVRWLFTVPGFLVGCILYQVIAWTVFGRTLGQGLMGLQVVRRKSTANLHVLQAFGRAVVCTLFPLGLAWVVLSPKRRSVQDIAARSRVIYGHRRR